MFLIRRLVSFVSQMLPRSEIISINSPEQMVTQSLNYIEDKLKILFLIQAAYFIEMSCKSVNIGYSWSFKAALKMAQEVLDNYQTFKLKYEVVDNEELQDLQSFDAIFQLLVIHYKFRLNLLNLENQDMQVLKDLVILAHKLTICPELLRFVYDKFHSGFLSLNETKISKVFLMLTVDCGKRIMAKELETSFFAEESDEVIQTHFTFGNIYAELLFFSVYSMSSCQIIQSETVDDKKKSETRELMFADVLEILGIVDIYPALPDYVRDFNQAKMLFDQMTLKVDEFEEIYKYCKKNNVQGPTELTPYYISFWRGLVHHDLSRFQKDLKLQSKLAEKSLELWNQFLADCFSKKSLEYHMKTYPCNNAINIFENIIARNDLNYTTIINYKVSTIIDLNPDVPAIDPTIREVNELRRKYINQLMKALDFELGRPGLAHTQKQLMINYQIAVQYRSIIVKNRKNQKKHLKQSIPYLLKVDKLWYTLEESSDSINPKYQAEIATLSSFIDKDDKFIQKFRKF